jgi:hypothetical protein
MSTRALQPVSAPLSSTPLPRLIYILTTLSILLLSYYSYRGLQYKSAEGGWWDTALGRTSIINGDESVEDRINGIARELGIPSNELASAIAGVVRQYVPPASLSSIAAKETGKIMESLLKVEETPQAQAGVVEQVMNFCGMDELD